MADDLVGFLRARLDEDEKFAQAAAARDGGEWDTTSDGDLCTVGTGGSGYFGIGVYGGSLYETGEFIARNSPKRALREVEAKRRIIDAHSPVDPCDAHDDSLKSVPCETLMLLASVYQDHPDYRAEWRP